MSGQVSDLRGFLGVLDSRFISLPLVHRRLRSLTLKREISVSFLSKQALRMAAFRVITYGRIEVITEEFVESVDLKSGRFR